jgi:hypothetical protein
MFSIRWRFRLSALSWGIWMVRFDFGGMQAVMSCLASPSRNQSASCPLSAISAFALGMEPSSAAARV